MPRVSRFIMSRRGSSAPAGVILSLISSLTPIPVDHGEEAVETPSVSIVEDDVKHEVGAVLNDEVVGQEGDTLLADASTSLINEPVDLPDQIDDSVPAPESEEERASRIAWNEQFRQLLEEMQKSRNAQLYKAKAMREQLEAKLALWKEHCSKYEDKYDSVELKDRVHECLKVVRETLEKGEDAGVAIKELETAISNLSAFKKAKLLTEDMSEEQILEIANLGMRDLIASSVEQAKARESQFTPASDPFNLFNAFGDEEENDTSPSIDTLDLGDEFDIGDLDLEQTFSEVGEQSGDGESVDSADVIQSENLA